MTESRVLVIGDSVLDTYWHGSCSRINPEAPIPVVKYNYEEFRAGGAANVALGLKSLGSNVSILTSIGNDIQGSHLKSILLDSGVEVYNHPGQEQTTNKLRVLVNGQQLARIDFDYYSPSIKSLCFDLENVSVIVLSDYNKGVLADCGEIISEACDLNIPVIVDPKGTDWKRYSGATLITPNEKEFLNYIHAAALDVSISSDDLSCELSNILFDVSKSVNVDAILCKLGSEGMELVTKDNTHVKFAARKVNVVDVTGAGDTVLACIANCIDKGINLVEACRRSNIAASMVVEKMGTSVVNEDELHNMLYPKGTSQKIIIDRERLLKLCNLHKNCDLTVVFTNGCFDIIHEGHVQYLEEAAELGDILIVALNDDDSVRKIKGDGRPINKLESRLKVMSSLGCVSYVIPFWEEKPIPLIELLQPNIIVKGGDYENTEDIIGYDVVEKYGGRAVLLSAVPNISTSSIISKINESGCN